MKTIQIELPLELSLELEGLGLAEGPGIADWIAEAIRQRLSAAKQLQYLESRALRGDGEKFVKVLAKVPPLEPAEEDRGERIPR
jgi:hypothetical protein